MGEDTQAVPVLLPDERVSTGTEREVLTGFLDMHRGIVANKLAGVSDEDARRRLVPSATTLLGLLKHLASVEREWFGQVLGRRPLLPVPGDGFIIEPDDTVAGVLADYRAACEESRAAAGEHDLDYAVPHDRLGSVSLRWILVHMIEETARHAGHADILREQTDGSTGFDCPEPGAGPARWGRVRDQVERLIGLGVAEIGGVPAARLRAAAGRVDDGVLVVRDARPSTLAPLLERGGRRGFVVTDMTDADDFDPTVDLPDARVYVLRGLDRGDAMANWSPDEALTAIAAAGRTPLTLTEGICWLLQEPGVLERNHCFMTIGSRRRRPDGSLDARTPAIWISNGTGRDGPDRKDAPKIGWCWAGNRHTWLGFASAAERRPVS